MITGIAEHKIQTELQSNIHIAQYGTVVANSGDNTITFPRSFVTRPVIIVNGTEMATGASSQPVVYVVSLHQNSDGYYDSVVIYSDASAINIDWIALGVII